MKDYVIDPEWLYKKRKGARITEFKNVKERRFMEEVLIQQKVMGPEGVVIVKARKQLMKRGSHGRFTHYVPLKKLINEGVSALIGLVVVILIGFIGYFYGIQSCINSVIISPLP